LLEVSAGIKSRYQSQSQVCEPIHLIKSLEISNKTEQELRTSKNQRLTIELGLLQLCLLYNRPESPSQNDVSQPVSVSSNPSQVKPATPPPEKKTIVNFRTANPIKTISIQQHLQSGNKKVEAAPQDTQHSVTEDLPAEEINAISIADEWKKYAESLKSKGRTAMWGTMTLHTPSLNGLEIIYEVQNESQLKELELEKPMLMDFLRKNLNNYHIQLSLIKADAPPKNKPFSAEDKIKALEEKNPNIAILRKKLGLEPD
jgi:DNA polymerase-3 subunit gamma/tau